MDKIISINNLKMRLRTYNGNRVLTLVDLTEILNQTNNRMSKKFYSLNKNKKKALIDGIDYYKLPKETYYMFLNKERKGKGGLGGYLITESGAKKILSDEDDYITKYILNCYYNDFDPPIKEKELDKTKDKDKANKTKNKIIEPDIDINKTMYLIGNAFDNLTKKQVDILNEIKKENDRFLNELKGLFEEYQTKENYPDPPLDIEGNQDFHDFKKDITNAANKILSKHADFKSTNDVLSLAYNLLRSQYGVVWEQEKKDFYKQIGRSPVNTLELEWWIERRPEYRNLLIGKLNTIYSKGKEVSK